MTIEQLIGFIFQKAPFIIIKLIAIVTMALHLAFSFVVIRQTKIMIKVLEAKISPAIYSISVLHFLFSLFVFIWVILFL